MIQDVCKISLLLIIKVYARENHGIEVHDPYSRELLKFLQYNSGLDKGFEKNLVFEIRIAIKLNI